MPLEHKSGDLTDQELINLLYECARLYFINTDRKPTIDFGWTLYITLCEAIRRGYMDTERFPEICSKILNYYYQIKEKPINFIVYSFQDSVCFSHGVTRAMIEILFHLYQFSELEGANNKSFRLEDRIELLKILATMKTVSVNYFWKELSAQYKNVCYTNYEIINERIKLISQHIDEMTSSLVVNKSMLDAEDDCLREFTTIGHPGTKYLLFNTIIKLIHLYNNLNFGNSETRGGYLATKELAVINLLESTGNIGSLEYNAVDYAMKYGSIPLRIAIARIIPELGLTDGSARVRIMALSTLSNVTYPISSYGKKILDSCDEKDTEETSDTRKMKYNILALYHAAAPVLAKLAVENPTFLVSSLKILMKAAYVSKDSDAQHKPAQSILNAFEFIFDRSNMKNITDNYFNDKELKKFVKDYCTKWTVCDNWKEKEVQDVTVKTWISNIKSYMNEGDYLKALYEIINLRTKSPEVYINNKMDDVLNGTILPQLRNKEFPLYDYYEDSNIPIVDENVVNSFDRMYYIFQNVLTLCADDAKRVINLPSLMFDTILGIIYYITINRGCDQAREWLNQKNISYAVMYEYISNWDYAIKNGINPLKIIKNLPKIMPEDIPPLLSTEENPTWDMIKNANGKISIAEEKPIKLEDVSIFNESKIDDFYDFIPSMPNYGY